MTKLEKQYITKLEVGDVLWYVDIVIPYRCVVVDDERRDEDGSVLYDIYHYIDQGIYINDAEDLKKYRRFEK